MRFFQHRLGVNLTYYRTNTYNQFFKLPALAGDKYAYRYVNAGNIQNRGWELTLNGTPVLTPDFNWKTSVNFSTNKNKIVKLHEDLKEMIYGPTSFSSSYAMKLIKGVLSVIYMVRLLCVMMQAISFTKQRVIIKDFHW